MTLMRTSRGTYLLLVRYSDEAAEDVAKVVDDLGGKLKNKTVYKDETELTVQIRFKGTDTPFLTELQEMNGVSNAVLVEFTGE